MNGRPPRRRGALTQLGPLHPVFFDKAASRPYHHSAPAKRLVIF
jgi:hypothetical protein